MKVNFYGFKGMLCLLNIYFLSADAAKATKGKKTASSKDKKAHEVEVSKS